jgi:hypothetical protein
MADDPVTDTQSSQTQTTPTDDAAASSGGTDAGSGSDVTGDAGSNDTFLGSAQSDAGDGHQGKGGSADGDQSGSDGDDQAAAADGPPETYELTPLKIAGEDGAEIEVPIDAALLTEATPIFKEAGLTNEQAQKLAPLVLKVQDRLVEQQADDFAAMRAGWAKDARADKEIGGANWKETETLAAKALDTFGAGKDSEFRKLLNESGFGDHPEMIRMFRNIGEKLGEDPLTPSAQEGKVEKPDRVRTLYPDDLPKEGAK